MQIRVAQPTDISILSEYWYDNMVVLQQTHPHLQIRPDGQQIWEQAASNWMTDKTIMIVVSSRDEVLTGCMIGTIGVNMPGLLPLQYGVVMDFFLDLHTKQPTLGTGQGLFAELKQWWLEHNIHQCRVSLYPNAPVQQAFWRGIGAKSYTENFQVSL